MSIAPARIIFDAFSRAVSPRKPLTVSQWADADRTLSNKGSAKPGQWRTKHNPPLREPMDAMSARSTVHDVVLKFPIQFGKTEVAANTVGYTMCHNPGPIMVCLPSEATMAKWVQQKLNPMIDECAPIQKALSSLASRDGSNTKVFKDFAGGQLYIEHAGTPGRLKLTTVRTMICDEVDDFASALTTGDDPLAMLNGRTSAYPATAKRLFIGTPQIKGVSRIDHLYETSDQRRYYVPCPHCGARQPLEWSGLHWTPDGKQAWYACRENGCVIEEHHKTAMILAGAWVAENPESKVRGYTINCLYYQIGLGPRWLELIAEFRDAANDPAKLKTFVNERLAESWEDPAMRAVKFNVLRDRAEDYRLRVAQPGVLAITCGVDTQDDRLAVHFTGWGRGLASWTLDYVELPGDPENEGVWNALTELVNRPIEMANGGALSVEGTAIDAGGHRTEAVKRYVAKRLLRRVIAVFGAVPNNAPVLSKGKLQEVNNGDQLDKTGIKIHHVGTVAIKHMLYARIGADAEKQRDARLVHISADLPAEYFNGLVSETYDPKKNRFEKKRGVRNEPLDTWVYSYAVTHHPELRLHRRTKSEWDAAEAAINALAREARGAGEQPAAAPAAVINHQPPRTTPAAVQQRAGFGRGEWSRRL